LKRKSDCSIKEAGEGESPIVESERAREREREREREERESE
jgi:hypothetical protein